MRDILQLYDEIRQYFISQSENKRIFFSPVFGQRSDSYITKQFYTEIIDGKSIYIRHSDNIEGKYYFTFNNAFMMSMDVYILDISLNIEKPIEFDVLWSMRVDWINKSYDRSKFLKKYNHFGSC